MIFEQTLLIVCLNTSQTMQNQIETKLQKMKIAKVLFYLQKARRY